MELDEYNVDIYNELGICFYSLGDFNSAINIFNRGIDLNQEDYKIFFNRGMTYLELGNLKEAMEDINMAYKLNPNDTFVKDQKMQLENLLNLE